MMINLYHILEVFFTFIFQLRKITILFAGGGKILQVPGTCSLHKFT